jgi:hypothetical protein
VDVVASDRMAEEAPPEVHSARRSASEEPLDRPPSSAGCAALPGKAGHYIGCAHGPSGTRVDGGGSHPGARPAGCPVSAASSGIGRRGIPGRASG